MYSLQIDEHLVPALYCAAKARGMPMTRFVAKVIRQALKDEPLPQAAKEALRIAGQTEYEVVMEVKTSDGCGAGRKRR